MTVSSEHIKWVYSRGGGGKKKSAIYFLNLKGHISNEDCLEF